jgi:hypothetical protein
MRHTPFRRLGVVLLIISAFAPLVPAAESVASGPSVSAPAGFTPVKQPTSSNLAKFSERRLKMILSALDLSRNELLTVKEAAAAEDHEAALKALAAYMRERQRPAWGELPPGPRNTKIADAAAEGRVVGGLVAVEHQFPGGNINWLFNPTEKNPDVAFNPEWQWQLNRMNLWWDLGRAYVATKDEKYARAFVSQMTDWVAECTVPQAVMNKSPSAWRTIEAGLRTTYSWPDAWFTFLDSPSFTDAAVVTMLGSFLDHARYLRAHPTIANWLAMEMAGLYTTGAMFPEFKESSEWRDFAARTMAAEADKQFLPDGGQVELTPAYHNATIDNVLRIADVARRTGRKTELPPAYISSMEKTYDFLLTLMTPDRNLPRFNDSWPVPAQRIYTQALKFFPERQDFQWALDPAGQGRPPEFTSRFLDWSGFAVMRSDWSPAANYLVFDVGPLGFAHVHQDKLNIVLWAHGRELLLDSGGASYERSKWRTWSLSTAAHNCVMVDGLGQDVPEAYPMEKRLTDAASVAQGPINAHWVSTPVSDYARGVFDQGFGPSRLRLATHQREVLFLKPDLYVVADRLTPNDEKEHTYQARWHLLSTSTTRDEKTGQVVTTDPAMANLAIVPLLTQGLSVEAVSAQEEPEILGWNTRKDMTPPRLPCTTVLHTRKGKGEQRFLALLLPLKPDQSSPVRRVGREGADTVVEFNDGRKFLISTEGGLSASELPSIGGDGRKADAR